MISYIRGELADVREDQVVIDVGGVGYGIFMSGSDIARLPSTGQEVKINTYLHVKEDVMQLFGFLTRDGLEVFRLIIGVSGIGPKGGYFQSSGDREKDGRKADSGAERQTGAYRGWWK